MAERPVSPSVATSPWVASRRRAEALRDRHAFAAEVLTLYLALLDVWEEAWDAARTGGGPGGQGGGKDTGPGPGGQGLAGWAAERVLPRVVDTTVRYGPERLGKALAEATVTGAAGEELLAAWLTGAELAPLERYLARAALRGPLEGVDAGAACARDPARRGGRRCPACGGPPQLSFRTDAGDQLVSGRRRLLCARCGQSWSYSGSTCASCGETAGRKRTIYSERRTGPQVGHGRHGADADATAMTFPHLRIEGCESCRHYLIDVDLGRDPRAVPEVDELAALPLDLYAAERGISKITPNLMGF